MISRRSFAGVSLAALAGCSTARESVGYGETIVFGGPIYTGVGGRTVEALRISGGRVQFAGSLADAERRGARRIDLGGDCAYPGFTDSHVHLIDVGLMAMRLDLTGVASLAELQQRLRAYAEANPQGPIVGAGWIETHWPEGRFPTRADLDVIVGDRSVFLSRADGHAAVVNSTALAMAGIEAATRDPEGGRIEREGGGAPSGVLIDTATALVEARLPPVTRAQKQRALAEAARLYAARGWTGVHQMGVSYEDARLFHLLGNDLPLTADLYLSQADAPQIFAQGPVRGRAGRVWLRGVKLYVDGALGSRGAALFASYNDAPGDGLLVTPVDELKDLMRRARAANVQVATHAIGDRGNFIALNAYDEIFADDPQALRSARWRIEHAQVVAPMDIRRFGDRGVIASMQPSHAISDLHFAPARLGQERLAGAYAWRSLLDAGATVAAGSDAPVEKGDPLHEFYAAAYRRDLNDFTGPGWHPEQAVSRVEALRMLTAAPAYAAFRDAEKGRLAPGMSADLSVFSADIMQAPFSDIPRAQAVLTMVAGEITHDAR